MKVALVHDLLVEYGGAERVLEKLTQMFPDAPIYTAFTIRGSTAWQHFHHRKIIESSLAPVLKRTRLYSPLRFLAPWIWEGFDFQGYDLVISSASWYITKGIVVPPDTFHICYCHTPPRYLYGLPTAVEWQRYPLVKLYASVVNRFLRNYDFHSAQRVDQFIVNSETVLERVKKVYGREATVISPPVQVKKIRQASKGLERKEYYLIVSRVVGAKGLDMAIKAANRMKLPLKIVGETAGLAFEEAKLKKLQGKTVEFLGRVDDDTLWRLYAQAKGFLALAENEDFGMTVVEAQAAGTPVIAYYGGGYRETVVEGKTGVFFRDYSVKSLCEALERFDSQTFNAPDIMRWAERFDERHFEKRIKDNLVPIQAGYQTPLATTS